MTIYKRAGPILMKVRVACASLSLWYYLLLLIGATSLHIFFQDGSILQCIDVQHLKRDTEETNEICNCKNLPQVVREAWLSNDNDCRPIYNQMESGVDEDFVVSVLVKHYAILLVLRMLCFDLEVCTY
uniref:Uncharacterized protein n=1 Tax=Vitis vinifera TaxID=29760 RepID=F6HK53_VITVI